MTKEGLVDRSVAILADAVADPGSLRGVVRGAVALARARAVFRNCEIGRRVRAFGNVRVIADGRIELEDFVFFLEGMIPAELVCHPGGRIVVGERSGFNYGVSIEAKKSVTIGKDCLFGAMVRIEDTLGGTSAPITIGDDVWVAHGAIIQPGVTIGKGSVISAGSVVVSDVPPGRMAIGNPARAVPLQVRQSGSPAANS